MEIGAVLKLFKSCDIFQDNIDNGNNANNVSNNGIPSKLFKSHDQAINEDSNDQYNAGSNELKEYEFTNRISTNVDEKFSVDDVVYSDSNNSSCDDDEDDEEENSLEICNAGKKLKIITKYEVDNLSYKSQSIEDLNEFYLQSENDKYDKTLKIDNHKLKHGKKTLNTYNYDEVKEKNGEIKENGGRKSKKSKNKHPYSNRIKRNLTLNSFSFFKTNISKK